MHMHMQGNKPGKPRRADSPRRPAWPSVELGTSQTELNVHKLHIMHGDISL